MRSPLPLILLGALLLNIAALLWLRSVEPPPPTPVYCDRATVGEFVIAPASLLHCQDIIGEDVGACCEAARRIFADDSYPRQPFNCGAAECRLIEAF